MGRSRGTPSKPVPSFEVESQTRAKTLDEFVGDKKTRRREPGVDKLSRAHLIAEADEMRKSGDYDDLRAGHMVALYVLCHHRVYGVYPAELDSPKTFGLARFAAARLLKQHLRDDPKLAARFIQWTWVREEGREKWRRQNGREGARVGWALQFSAGLVTEYRVDLARKRR